MVTPVPKGKPNTTTWTLKDEQKIAFTADYSKNFEHYILNLINQDISAKLGKRQYGREIDQIRQYQDDPGKLAVILNSHDWSAAFDKLDTTMAAGKCIKIGIKIPHTGDKASLDRCG